MEDEARGPLLDPASEAESDESEPLLASSVFQNDAPRGHMLTRHVFALLSFLGFANVYAMRVNLSGKRCLRCDMISSVIYISKYHVLSIPLNNVI